MRKSRNVSLVKTEPKNYFILKRSMLNLEEDEQYDALDWQMIPVFYENEADALIGIETYTALLMLNHPIITNPYELTDNVNFIGVIPVKSSIIKHIFEDDFHYEAIVIEQFNFED
jgi:hypothetical protein